ncbi:CAZyme family GH18 [Paecilomyces variotii]|nr:CAZyme family GH18 [Paecilomyces variotii]KAJ9256284.1 CAZyme family GH18 [Paecilomyces variotii]KAJ9329834.1 CAZyme family GH18 [Paecilomyces variotii]KAJ9350378.1 CAZyme family GH18 [Paecilomyces variotii]KAJ9395752.1 CAZyme family GH18 [Paecilomyces variotii]
MNATLSRGLLLGSLLGTLVSAATGGSGTCSSTSECVSGCCSSSGYCGFGPDFCGDDVCISTCDALAECGPYAEVANTTCPLNVCCSPYGFCGTTEDFCGTGCQSNCDAVTEPSCSGTSSEAVYIGYYEAWNYQHPCDVIHPSDIDVAPWTHLYYAFAGINSETSEIETLYANDEEYIPEFTALKKKKSELKTFISVGGWDLGGEVFSSMVSFPGTRSAFITSASSFMKKYGFDGIDIDWEYPAASDRGGKTADTANYVSFLKELREECGDTYGITVTLPSSYWYLKGFDISSMAEYVDYFNFMSYDIHGTWDGESNYTSSVVNPHTNLTEISEGLDLLWRNNIDPGKVLLGLGFYGRSFTLLETNCTTPGCPFDTSAFTAGGASPGQCTQTSGILSDYEINRVLEEYDPIIQYNEAAAVNWITWNENQWVSFDNAKTFKQKADFANDLCLGGLFSWALDLGGPGSLANPNEMNALDTSMAGASTEGGSDGTGDFYVGQEIYNSDNGTVTGIGPINMIFPPSTLGSPTTIYPGPFITPLEVAWPTTTTITTNNTVYITTTVTRVVQTTTITLNPIITGTVQWWNWNITASNQTTGTTTLFPSIGIGPIVIQDNPNPLGMGTASHTVTSNRTIVVPPWPWSTTSLPTTVPTGPIIHFTEGSPPSPTCTANCGNKCTTFCEAPCMINCNSGYGGDSTGFDDPSDPDPPHHQKCAGPDCKNGECTGSLCAEFGCSGSNCDSDSGICLGSDCEETGCMGDDCGQGICKGSSCQTVGCIGSDCSSGSGTCFGIDCLSIGCLGALCNTSDGTCSGSDCHKVSCSGTNCKNGVCSGEGCTNEETDCESEEADMCTEFVYSTLDTAVSTYTTETSISCNTITACYAEATTTTTTISNTESAATPFMAWAAETDTAVMASAASKIDAAFRAAESSWTSTSTSTTSSTSTSTTTSTTSTTTGPAATSLADTTPNEVSYSCSGMSKRCGTFENLASFCKVAKSYLRGDEIYGTTSANSNSGACYTDDMNAGFGCGVFVKGEGCQLKGTAMQAAFDHLMDADLGGCKICGQVLFSNGCHMRVDYVSGCTQDNNGPAQFVTFNPDDSDDDDTTSATAAVSTSPAILTVSSPLLTRSPSAIPWVSARASRNILARSSLVVPINHARQQFSGNPKKVKLNPHKSCELTDRKGLLAL